MRATLAILALPLIAAALYAQFAASASLANTITNALVMVVMVTGLSIYVGNTGILSFAHPAFAGVAAFATAIGSLPVALKGSLLPNLPGGLSALALPPAVSGAVGVLVAGAAGAAVAPAIARLGGAAAAIATLGLLIIAHSLFVGGTTFTRGAQAIYAIPKVVTPVAAAGAAIAAVAAALWFKSSRWGLLARAAREDEPAARSVGVDVVRARLVAFILSAMVVGLGGVLFAHHLGVISPREFYFTLSFSLLTMLIVGGQGSVSGAVVGVALITVLIEVLRDLESGFALGPMEVPALFGLTTVGVSAALLLTLYLRSAGIFGNSEVHDLFPAREAGEPQSVVSGSAATAASGNTLEAENIVKRYGGHLALDGVSLTLGRGEIVGLIGSNGSGKTTLLSCLTGVQAFDGGSVRVGGEPYSGRPAMDFARAGVARTFQNIRLFGSLSVRENIAAALIASGAADRREADRWLTRMRLCEVARRRAKTLAYGPQRRLEIARALATRPDFVLLDEPAAGMNAAETATLLTMLADLRDRDGLGLLLVDHDLHLILSLCDRVIVLNEGKVIASGTPGDIRADDAVARAYFGQRRRQSAPAPAAS
ncbi:MAG: ATP-binding cassette domain-containing protein [Pseudomonadota bacterium]